MSINSPGTRSWGIAISTFYAVLVAGVLLPFASVLGGGEWRDGFDSLRGEPFLWTWIVLLVVGQALLLFVSVDPTFRLRRPRRHIALTAAAAAFAVALLSIAALWSLVALFLGDPGLERHGSPWVAEARTVLAWWLGLWAFWAAVFYAYYRSKPARVADVISWLLRGSVLELLIAVPAHVVVRRRDECSAPTATGFGIVTGLAVMLMCFGPGVWALYKKRVERYQRHRAHRPAA